MSQSENVEAIQDWSKRQTPVNTEAAAILGQLKSYLNQGSWYDRNMSGSWYNELVSRRNQYNLANVKSAKEREGVVNQLATAFDRPANLNPQTGVVGKAKPPAVGTSGLNRILQKGVSGNDVKTWQTFLGLTPPTGYFDAITDSKTRAYQAASGLVVDGKVGKNTWGKAFGAKPAPFAPTPTAAAAINNAFSKPAAAPSSGFSKPAAATSSQFKPSNAPTSSKPSASPTPPLSTQASMVPNLSDIASWPVWAKVVGAGTLAAGLFFGVKYHEEHVSKGR